MSQLVELNFEVLYKPGQSNTNAEALSQLPSNGHPEQEDTEKDFICLSSEEVRGPKQRETGVKVAVQTSINQGLCGYNWNEIKALQRCNTLLDPIYNAISRNERPSCMGQQSMLPELKKLCRKFERLQLHIG